MAAKATIRELRNKFPKIRKLIEEEGEVLVTERGTPRYRLTRYVSRGHNNFPASKNYLARLRRHQPRPLSAAAARALDNLNRGER
jgi:hypothetical protein